MDYFNDTVYAAEEQEYWSQQQSNTRPLCRFSPTTAEEVSAAIVEIRKTKCQFAVKSGGHASFKGGSNIQGGIAIDLKYLNELEVSADRTITHAGPGNRWENVYAKLDQMKLAVIGGRNGDIGVGGLTLGGTMSSCQPNSKLYVANQGTGGISFFSGVHGWACDNVKNYQVQRTTNPH